MSDNLQQGTENKPIDYASLGNAILNFSTEESKNKSNTEPSPADEQISEEESEIAAEDSEQEQVPDAEKQVVSEATSKAEIKKYKVKVDQEELEVDEQELLNGYSRQSDYSRKTQALAEERKALEKEREEIKAKYGQKIEFETDFFEAQLKAEFKDINWQELEQTDREEYLYQREKLRERTQQLEAKKAELLKIRNDEMTEFHKKNRERLAQEAELLAKADPDFADPKKKEQIGKELVDFLKANNHSPEEIERIIYSTHRNILLVKKAMEFDKIQKANLKTKKVVTTPSITKSSNFRPKPNQSNNLNAISDKAKKGDKAAITQLVSAFINSKN
ncbi:MAG: hypothetical protein EBS06_05405 [Proteobacteria bacterium]|nr:hypothetical protein [Pseudomonadota bacterium]